MDAPPPPVNYRILIVSLILGFCSVKDK